LRTSGAAGGRSKAGLHAGHQPPEEAPRQPGVVGENDALSFGNHGVYIAIWAAADNEDGSSGGSGLRTVI
jgi:hypothetical protein